MRPRPTSRCSRSRSARSSASRSHSIMAEAQKRTADINEARLIIVPPPLIQGIGSAGGYRMIVEDRTGHSFQELSGLSWGLIGKANQTPGLKQVYTLFDISTPRVFADIDRRKADMLGVPPERVFEALQVYLGSAFINDFNLLGRTYRVTAQADAPYRATEADIANLRTRSNSGAMVPIGSVTTFQDRTGPVSRVALQRLPGGRDRWRHRARLFVRPVAEDAWRSSRPKLCRPASRPNGPASPTSRRRPAARRAWSSAWPCCSSSWCSRRSSKA